MRSVRVLFAVAAITAATVAPASARTHRVKTDIVEASIFVTFSGSRVTNISGSINSAKSKCLPGRTILAEHSPDQGTTVFTFGTGNTAADGTFTINGDGPKSDQYALTLRTAKVGHLTCKGDFSLGGPFA